MLHQIFKFILAVLLTGYAVVLIPAFVIQYPHSFDSAQWLLLIIMFIASLCMGIGFIHSIVKGDLK